MLALCGTSIRPYKFDWDAIVCFDQRYKDYLVKFFPAEKIHMVPYPCHPLKFGDKGEAGRFVQLFEELMETQKVGEG